MDKNYNAKMIALNVGTAVMVAVIVVSIVMIISSIISIQASNATIATATAQAEMFAAGQTSAFQLQEGVTPDALQAGLATLAALDVLEVTAIARYENIVATQEIPAQAQLQTTPLPDALLQTERGSFYATQEQANAEWANSVNATFEASWTHTPTPRPCRAENWLETSWDDEERMFFVGIIPSLNGAESVEAIRAIPEVETFVFDPAGSFRDYERWVGTLRDDVTPSDVEARIVEALEIMCDEFIAQGAPECSPGMFLTYFDGREFEIYLSRLMSWERAVEAVRAIPEVMDFRRIGDDEYTGTLREDYSASPDDVEQRIVEALDVLCEGYR